MDGFRGKPLKQGREEALNPARGYQALEMIGAAGGDRTHDPWLRRPILYPLSYSRAVRSPGGGARIPGFPGPVHAILCGVGRHGRFVYNPKLC